MYIATQTFWSSSGKPFAKGTKISNWTYFWMPQRDKVNFVKKGSIGKIVKPYTQSSEKEREEWRNRVGIVHNPKLGTGGGGTHGSLSSNNSHMYDTSLDGYPTHHHITHYSFPSYDDSPSSYHSSHNHSHDSHSSHDSGSYDSGYSSSDSSSCDSGGADCGGGDCGGGCD